VSRANVMTVLAAAELTALAELLKEQAHDLTLRGTAADCHWGDAGTAQTLAHDTRKIVARAFYAQAGNSEAEAERLVGAAVAEKLAKMGVAT
jgi:hypothetical protein